jgi:tyrosyl-DNA phosphodiesterase-1
MSETVRDTVRAAWLKRFESHGIQKEEDEVQQAEPKTVEQVVAVEHNQEIIGDVDHATVPKEESSTTREETGFVASHVKKPIRGTKRPIEEDSAIRLARKKADVEVVSLDSSDQDDDDIVITKVKTPVKPKYSAHHKVPTQQAAQTPYYQKIWPDPPFRPIHNPLYDDPKLGNSITLGDILGSDTLKRTYLFSYQYDLDFILGELHNPEQTEVVLIYQEGTLMGLGLFNDDNVRPIKVFMKPYTSHHPKLIINEYQDGTIKLWILSCNLRLCEFETNNQIFWESPFLRRGEDNQSQFKNSLISMIRNYSKPELQKLVKLIQETDFSLVIGDFIASATSSNSDSFGFMALYNALKAHNAIPHDYDVHRKLLYQVSSIASPFYYSQKAGDASNIFTHFLAPMCLGAFGPNPAPKDMHIKHGDKCLRAVMESTNSELVVMFPSEQCIKDSLFGSDSGAWSMYNTTSVKGQAQNRILQPLMHKSVSRQRGTNPNHTKFLIMTSDNFKTLDWVLFTSHNMSKQAWGNPLNSRSEDFKTKVDNYEAGILITKDHYPGKRLVPVEIGERYTLREDEVPIILPFRVPPPSYNVVDKPWCIFNQ